MGPPSRPRQTGGNLKPSEVGHRSEGFKLPMRIYHRLNRRERKERSQGKVKRIDVLPDDILLDVFDFYVNTPEYSTPYRKEVESWHLLVHVCRRWRGLVLESPRRLNLQVCCTPRTPSLDTWPALPLIIHGRMDLTSSTGGIIAALRQSSRVCEVDLLSLADRQLGEVLAAMHVPFPELTNLRLASDLDCCEPPPIIPDSFLDGSAPGLRYVTLSGVPFPALPKHLLSATHLVQLWLESIPHSGYFPPEAIVVLLSVLSTLETLSLQFQSPQSRPGPGSRRPPPSKRSVIPALTSFYFKGATEYLEDLVTRIDTPQLDEMEIRFFNQIDFDIPRLDQFIHRTPKQKKRNARVQLDDYFARIRIYSPGSESRTASIAVSCKGPDWQLSSIEQVCNSSLHHLSTVEDLYIKHQYSELVWKDDAIEDSLWLQLLRPFTAVKNFYLSKEFAPGIAAALKELVGDRITEVLPDLQNIFVEGLESSGHFRENIGQFVAMRQLSDHLIAISDWDGI